MNETPVKVAAAAQARLLLERLFPICRSITGEGVRETIRIAAETAPWKLKSYASGTKVYDWTVPREWSIRDAHISTTDGKRVVDFHRNNLHVVSYSAPVRKRMNFAELRTHLHTLPAMPDAIPYRTSYYEEKWGFCLSQREFDSLNHDAEYDVVVDSSLSPGELNLAECVLPGSSGNEFIVSTYCCHPSMANDNLSGVVVATLLLARLASCKNLRHTWRFVMLPETIGAITYLAENEERMKNCAGGFVLTTCGGPGPIGIKESFLGDALVDRAVTLACKEAGVNPVRYPFVPNGSDERQYSSPGFRIPVTSITKDKYYEYAYYHTSLDNLSFVSGEALEESLNLYLRAIDILENNRVLVSTNQHGEAQLGRRGLYPQTGGAIQQQSGAHAQQRRIDNEIDVIGWLLFLADGRNDLIDMAERSGVRFSDLVMIAQKLEAGGLLDEKTNGSHSEAAQ